MRGGHSPPTPPQGHGVPSPEPCWGSGVILGPFRYPKPQRAIAGGSLGSPALQAPPAPNNVRGVLAVPGPFKHPKPCSSLGGSPVPPSIPSPKPRGDPWGPQGVPSPSRHPQPQATWGVFGVPSTSKHPQPCRMHGGTPGQGGQGMPGWCPGVPSSGGVHRGWGPPRCSLGQDLVEESLGLAFLLQVGLGSLLHQLLQVVGVLLHAQQQVVQDVAAALPAGKG